MCPASASANASAIRYTLGYTQQSEGPYEHGNDSIPFFHTAVEPDSLIAVLCSLWHFSCFANC